MAAATNRSSTSAGELPQESFAGNAAEGERGAEAAHHANSQLSWSIWPLKENVYRSTAVVFFLALVVWAIASWFGPEWILPAAFILIFMLAGFFFPTHYHMDSKSITVRGLISRKRRLWSSLEKYHLSEKGVHLVPEGRTSQLGVSRGVYLPYGDRHDEVLGYIEKRLRRGH